MGSIGYGPVILPPATSGIPRAGIAPPRNNARMRRLLCVSAALLLAGCATFDLQGHRGARGLAPENTLPAFAKALEIGVATLELDTGVTRDGVVVISHEVRLNPDFVRGPDGEWLTERGPAIHDVTFAELARYDVGRLKPGTAYARGFPEQVAVDGTRIPRLADLFAMVRDAGDRSTRFNIETKISPLAPGDSLAAEPFARAVIEEIRRGGMAHRSTLQSFDWRTLRIAQEEAREIPTVYLTAQQKFFDNVCTGAAAGSPDVKPSECAASPWTAGFQLRDLGSVPRMVKAAGGAVWSPFHRDVDAAKIAEAHSLGLKVVVWTVNDPAQIASLIDLGVDGLISDRPDVAKKIWCQRRIFGC
jgi:glycerophosphoryl diester phosphodiesterase